VPSAGYPIGRLAAETFSVFFVRGARLLRTKRKTRKPYYAILISAYNKWHPGTERSTLVRVPDVWRVEKNTRRPPLSDIIGRPRLITANRRRRRVIYYNTEAARHNRLFTRRTNERKKFTCTFRKLKLKTPPYVYKCIYIYCNTLSLIKVREKGVV